jgi:hypothetical protein
MLTVMKKECAPEVVLMDAGLPGLRGIWEGTREFARVRMCVT